jgi:3-oxoacyl-[acyl-carrier protein] reductase
MATNKPLDGEVALVTGAGRGIGRAIALRLGRDGATVAVHYGSSRAGAEAVVRDIEAAHGRAFAVQADLSCVSAIKAMFDTLDRELAARGTSPQIDILVNNAGVGAGNVPIAEITAAMFDGLFAVNTRSVFFVTQQSLSRLRDGGHVINISSLVTRGAMPAFAAYAASKAPVNSLTLSFAAALGPRRIAVNALLPGLVETDLTTGLTANPQMLKAVLAQTAFGRMGQPEDIANAVALLVSPDAGWITGQIIEVSGGTRL